MIVKETRSSLRPGNKQPEELDNSNPLENKNQSRSSHQTKHDYWSQLFTCIQPFCCSICKKQYKSREGLRLHNYTHQGRRFSCSICQNQFTQKSSLKTHMKSIHHSVGCPVCHKLFPQGPSYDQHLKTCLSL